MDPLDEHPASSRIPDEVSNAVNQVDPKPVASPVPTKTRTNGALRRLSSGVRPGEENNHTNKRMLEVLTTKPTEEHSASPKEPMGISHISSEDDSEPVVCRRRKRLNGSKTKLNLTGKDLVWHIIPSTSESDDEVLIHRPRRKIRKLKNPTSSPETSLVPGPLDVMDIEPSVLKVVDKLGGRRDCSVLIQNGNVDDVRLANLTAQETSNALSSLKRKSTGNVPPVSKLAEAVESENGQKTTYYWSPPERQANEPPHSEVLPYSSASSRTTSLVDNLRQAAAEQNNVACAGDIPVDRKKAQRSIGVSPMPKDMSDFSGRPQDHMRSTIEVADDSLSDEIPVAVELKHSMNVGLVPTADRKRAFVCNQTPELLRSVKDYIENTYNMFDLDLDEDDCWLHPSPPAPHLGRGSNGYIHHRFRWIDGDNDHALTVDFGIVLLLVQNRLTEMQKQGYITKGWRVNRICGNWTCCNWHHFAMETTEMSSARRDCFESSTPCRHNPPCLRDKKCHLLPARRITERPTKARPSTRPSPRTSITTAESSTGLLNPISPAKAITDRSTSPLFLIRSSLTSPPIPRAKNTPQLPSSSPPTRALHSREHSSLLARPYPPARHATNIESSSRTSILPPPHLPLPAQSASSIESSPRYSTSPTPHPTSPTPPASNIESSPCCSTSPTPYFTSPIPSASSRESTTHSPPPLHPSPTLSTSSRESTTHSPTHPPPSPTLSASSRESTLHFFTPPPPTTPTPISESITNIQETNHLPQLNHAYPNISIASKAREMFLPAAQNLKSALRAVGGLLNYQSESQTRSESQDGV